MLLKHSAQAGTFESSDILVLVEPVEEGSGRKIDLESIVLHQYGKDIKSEINKVLDKYSIKDIHLIAKDKGALNPTISARVETAVRRAADIQEGTLYLH